MLHLLPPRNMTSMLKLKKKLGFLIENEYIWRSSVELVWAQAAEPCSYFLSSFEGLSPIVIKISFVKMTEQSNIAGFYGRDSCHMLISHATLSLAHIQCATKIITTMSRTATTITTRAGSPLLSAPSFQFSSTLLIWCCCIHRIITHVKQGNGGKGSSSCL